MLKMPKPWGTCWGKLLTESGTSPGELEQYTRTVLQQTIYCDGIAALQAFRAAEHNDYERIQNADHQVILCKMNAEARLMLTRMGKKMAEICMQISDSPLINRWLQDIRQEKVPGT